jgi:hypothetical protein
MTPELAIVHFQIGQLSSDEIVSLANSWLNQGIYTDALNDIFMQGTTDSYVVFPLFKTAIQKLGVAIPSRIDAAKFLARDTLQKMVSGEIDLVAGANYLSWEIHPATTAELPDGKYLGSNLGFEYIFLWIREIWDCRDGDMILYYTNLPRHQAELKFLEHLKEEAEKWLLKYA